MPPRRLLPAALLAAAVLAAPPSAAPGEGEPRARVPGAPGPAALDPAALDPDGLARGLAEAIRFRTISEAPPGLDVAAEFAAFHAWLERRFPLVHRGLERELVGGRSLLFTWRGAEPALPAVALLSHQDVVPAESAGGAPWTHPPFAGVIADGHVWGRGAIDDKVGVVGILEACEQLLAAGFAPRRTLVLAFGHDEELGGGEGAARIAGLLAERGVALDLVLDEGGYLTAGAMPGVARPIALVATAEKGAAYVELAVRNEGPAHASTPALATPIGVLAGALHRLETQPHPTRLVPAARDFLEAIAPETTGILRLALSTLWLSDPLVRWRLSRGAATNSLVRTTWVATKLTGGPKDSAIPDVARAVVNARILPGESVASTVDRMRETIDDRRVALTVLRSREPSPTSPADGEAFSVVRRSVGEVFPDAAVAPILTSGGTDARFFHRLTPNVLRFLPVRGSVELLGRAHGVDERIPIPAYVDAIRFYRALVQNAAGGRS
jgi:carboxypeptidase PM20D1